MCGLLLLDVLVLALSKHEACAPYGRVTRVFGATVWPIHALRSRSGKLWLVAVRLLKIVP